MGDKGWDNKVLVWGMYLVLKYGLKSIEASALSLLLPLPLSLKYVEHNLKCIKNKDGKALILLAWKAS